LGGRVNEKSSNPLEELADSLVSDEDIMFWAPEWWRTVQLDDEGSYWSYKKPNPQWFQMVWLNIRKEELSAYDNWNSKKKKKGVCWIRRKSVSSMAS
jgi:hypothetical protein